MPYHFDVVASFRGGLDVEDSPDLLEVLLSLLGADLPVELEVGLSSH